MSLHFYRTRGVRYSGKERAVVHHVMWMADGTLSVSRKGDDDLYGSSVILRRASSIMGDAFTIWIDTKHPLPTGHLQYFYLFIEQTLPSASASNLWLQIWRQTGHVDDYQLVWQRLVYLNDSASYALYSVTNQIFTLWSQLLAHCRLPTEPSHVVVCLYFLSRFRVPKLCRSDIFIY